MNSPFPGVDPFLEAQGFWPDFHATFLTYLRDAILDGLPDSYEARIDERVVLIDPFDEADRLVEPDVAVTRRADRDSPAALGAVGVATVEPVVVPLLIPETTRQRHLEIRKRPGRELVTVIEILSPANKRGTGRDEYLQKRLELLYREVNLVELDLLLAGRRLPMAGPLPPGDFYALVSRAERLPACEVYAWTLRQPLPPIPIPLRPPDPDLAIGLQDLFAATYERGRYRRSVDYRATVAELSAEESAWAASLAAGSG